MNLEGQLVVLNRHNALHNTNTTYKFVNVSYTPDGLVLPGNPLPVGVCKTLLQDIKVPLLETSQTVLLQLDMGLLETKYPDTTQGNYITFTTNCLTNLRSTVLVKSNTISGMRKKEVGTLILHEKLFHHGTQVQNI